MLEFKPPKILNLEQAARVIIGCDPKVHTSKHKSELNFVGSTEFCLVLRCL